MSESEKRETGPARQNKSLGCVISIPARVLQWWTLDHWRAAADTLAKFAGVVGFIAAAQFFVLKPDIPNPDVKAYGLIDKTCVVERFYKETLLPEVVNQVIDNTNSRAMQGPSVFLQHTLEPLPEDMEEVLIDFYNVPSDYQLPFPSLYPQYAVHLASSGGLTRDELVFALRAIENSLYVVASVTVYNKGQAMAEGVTVTPPEPFKPLDQGAEPFNLPAGHSKTVTFRTDCYNVRSDLDSYFFQKSAYMGNLFGATNKPSEVLDKNTLVRIALGLSALWLITVIKDILCTPPKANDTGRDAR